MPAANTVHQPASVLRPLAIAALVPVLCCGVSQLRAQTAALAAGPASASPIAIVPIDSSKPDEAAVVTGALEVSAGKAMIATSGSVTAGSSTTNVILPRRGTLRVCASTTVKLAADTSVPAGGIPGLLMAVDHGAVEMSFANTPAASNADILMTPDFRILIGGPGASEVKVRLGREGDTCVDNSGKNAPYVVVTSLFDSGLYRVQPGQRVMFQHGSLSEVVDDEKESCGCPPPPVNTAGNEFPLAQSEGLTPTPVAPLAPPPAANPKASSAAAVPPLLYSKGQQQAPPALSPSEAAPPSPPEPALPPVPAKPAAHKKRGPFVRFGHFLRRLFGGD